MELDLGVSETCLKAGLLLGVLQCARKGCSFRVTGVAPSHCCQACELACDDQADHDNQCVQMPLLGLSLETRSERGLMDFQHFGSQLRQLLEDKGPLHLNSLPHFWDTAYGSGAWAKTRPVKSARKACNTYSNGVKVLNQVVHLLEDPDDDSPELQQRCQADLEHFGSLSPEDIDILTDEFELVLRDLQVSTAIAQLPVQDAASLWRCRLTVQAAEDKEATPSLSPEPVEVAAYGRSAEEAFTMARLYLLSRLSRWDASKQLPRARLLEKLLQDFAGEMVTDEVDEDSLETCRRQLQELLQILEDLLMTPPSSFGSVWQLLARSWPRILAFCKDERSLVSLLRSARGCNKRPSLGVWCQMAEEAAFQLESPVLELFEDLLVEEEGAAGAYARQQIFSLLVEQREQMLQETERSSREQRVKVTWHLREASFGCALAEPLKGKVDAVLLTNEQGSKFLCEALDESRLVVRASSCRLEELPGALSRRLSCQLLATYATIAGRQREALRKLPRKEKASFCPELRGAIIDSWAAREGRPEDEATLQRCAQLLAEDPVQDDPSEELLGQLTSPQQEALRNAQSRRCSLVRGPPGTGKTQVAAAVALAAAQGLGQGQRVLAVTQSHAAAINLHRRLESMGVIAARVGTTLTVAEVMEQKSFEEVKSCWGEDDEELNFLEEAQARREGTGDRSKELLKELQRCQFVVMRRMVIVSQVAVLTLASSGNVGLLQGMGTLPLLVVDEAAQVVEPGPWVPLSHGCQRLVLVGDEKQLPATIHHPLAFQRGLGISMFERFVRDGLVRMGNGFVQLDEQRRMHPSIAQFPSLAFYDGTVHDALETKQRQQVPGFPWPNPEYHVAFVECGFCEGEERRRSHANPREADVLLEVLSWCLSAGMKPCQIGVITGYSAQQELLQQRVAQLAKRLVFDPAELRVDTVDGFQGAERDLILASTVRSFSRVGFMRDPRRANVMLTRARRGLVVFGNGETLQTEEDTWKPWISWVRERGIELKAEVILPVEAGNDPGEPFTTPDLQSEVRSKWPPAWPAESTKPAEVPADRTNSAQSSALDWLAASEPCWPEVKVVPVPAAQEPVPQAEPEAMPEPREPRQPEELPEKLLEPSQPAEVWTEWVDPETGKLWLYNEVTGEAKWKD